MTDVEPAGRGRIAAGVGLLAVLVGIGVVVSVGRESSPEPTREARVVDVPQVAAGPSSPNVLLVLWDTVRADRMSVYGHQRETTPFLEELAAESLVFERAVSPAIWTVPSHASLFTGLPASSHGCHALWTWLDDHHVTLAEWLGENGYQTYLFSSNIYVEDKTNLTQGFDTREYSYQGRWKGEARQVASQKLLQKDRSTEISPGFRPSSSRALGWGKSVFKDSAPVAERALLQWLDKRDTQKPFFAFVNLMEAHSPRTPSLESRRELLTSEQIRLGLETDVSQTKLVDFTFGDTRFTDAEHEAIYGVYDASLLDLDKATRHLLESLEQRGVLDDTVVIITSDHGENLGEHGHFEHRFVIYEPLIHVPLIVRYPKAVKPGRVSSESSNLRIFATILDLLGLEGPDTSYDRESLLNREGGQAFSEIAGAEPGWTTKLKKRYPEADWKKLQRSYRSVSEGGWKYIRASDGETELYHLDEDPGELENLVLGSRDRAEQLSQELKERVQRIDKYDPAKRTGRDGPVRAKAGSETEQQLRLLGYVE